MSSEKFTVYTFGGSQWAGVVHLALSEKGFAPTDYNVQDVALGTADNFDPEYLKINPNGTVPSFTSPSLSGSLYESTDILRHLDSLSGPPTLVPRDADTKAKSDAILALVHSSEMDTNVILLQARDVDEMKAKKSTGLPDWLAARQKKLEQEHAAHPDHPFYGPKAKENGYLNDLYAADLGEQHEAFYKSTRDSYDKLAAGMDKLDSLLQLPYAAGEAVTEADFHAVPWLSHAMRGAGTNADEIQNFAPLEALMQKTVPGYKVGEKTRKWWANMAETAAFKEVFAKLR
ncbi:hypothetical protein K4F52_000220 [Lecanicillium sp. MT-2017a]|nr:hypothetical protein K4F52_000220 [Lecanicillium sp. MT-2017a]